MWSLPKPLGTRLARERACYTLPRRRLIPSANLRVRIGISRSECCGASRCRRVYLVRSSYQETDDKRRAPDSGPAEFKRPFAPPPPPPPPPRKQRSPKGFPFWSILLFLLVGAGLWWSYIDSQVPDVFRDKEGMQYMLTKAGNQVMVGEDTDGRVYFVDKGGNLYYDSGDPEVGMYVITADDRVYNLFDDGSGERQTVFVGTFQQLKTQKIKELGGIPVERLRKAFGEAFDGTVTGFDAPALQGQEPQKKDFGRNPLPKAIVEYEPDVVLEKEGNNNSVYAQKNDRQEVTYFGGLKHILT